MFESICYIEQEEKQIRAYKALTGFNRNEIIAAVAMALYLRDSVNEKINNELKTPQDLCVLVTTHCLINGRHTDWYPITWTFNDYVNKDVKNKEWIDKAEKLIKSIIPDILEKVKNN